MKLDIKQLDSNQHEITMELSPEITIKLKLLIPEIEDLECELTNIVHTLAKYRKEKSNGNA